MGTDHPEDLQGLQTITGLGSDKPSIQESLDVHVIAECQSSRLRPALGNPLHAERSSFDGYP